MVNRWRAAALAFSIVALSAAPVRAFPPELNELPPEKQLAYEIEQHYFEKHQPQKDKAFTAKAIPGLPVKSSRSFITEIRLLKGPSSPSGRYAEVIRYDYSTGLTFRTRVDLKEAKVTRITAEPNQPTPLSTAEIEIAASLVTSKQPGTRISPANANARALTNDSPSSKFHGHRLLLLWQDEPVRTNRFLVDLTTQDIVNPNF
jgi:hypothetical protein